MTTGVDAALDAIAAAGVDVRPGGADDAVDGVPAPLVARPRDTAGAADALRVAAERGLAVVARGSGSRLDWGLPPRRLDLLVDTSAMDAVVEHASGDLVVQAQAGVGVGDLQAVLGAAGQRLGVDPLTSPGHGGAGTVGGTVGGMIATGADGPLRLAHGAVRDLLIGITVVRADGVVARSGGKVVKNVAGYDLGKLMAGSWGTLALVTEAVFRLHPVPAAARWVVHPVAGAARAADVVRSQLVPSAVEIDREPDGGLTAAVLVEGVAEGVERRAALTRELLGGGELLAAPPPWWGSAPWEPGGTALRLTSTIGGVDALLAACAALPVPVRVRGSVGVGKLHAGIAAEAAPDEVAAAVRTLRDAARSWRGDVVVLRAPPGVRAAVDAWGPVRGAGLMRRVKDEFDPEHRLAPGRFAGGI